MLADFSDYAGFVFLPLVFIGGLAALLLSSSWRVSRLPTIDPSASVPLGYSDAPEYDEELPIWFGAMIGVIPAVFLVALGVVGRWIYRSRTYQLELKD